MPQITVIDFDLDERVEDKMWEHGITPDQLYELLDHRHVALRNRKNRVADYLFIGRDDGGRCITVPILPTHDPLLWRPVTAWPCKPSEAAALERG